jgi:predicted transcriptional regulator of viral defense system
MTTDQQSIESTRAFFARLSVFRSEEAAAAFGLSGRPRAAMKRLVYHAKQGALKPIGRGLWAAVPPGVDPAAFEPDRFSVAAAARPDAVVCLHGALELLGAAHSEWRVCTAYTAERRAAIEMPSYRVELLGHPEPLRRGGRERLGLRETRRLGRTVSFTGPERTLIEGLRRPERAGGLAELVESAAGFASLDFELLVAVLEAYGERALWGAAGWFLERFRESFLPPAALLARLEAERPRAPQYLVRSERGGRLAARWNLILPPGPLSRGEPGAI